MKGLVSSKALAILALALSASAVQAAEVKWDFTTGGVKSGSNFGNSIDYTSGAFSATATAHSIVNNYRFSDSQIQVWEGAGLGVCNQKEGLDCTNPIHQVDNAVEKDFVLFEFSSALQLDSVFIDPHGTWDRDVSFWIGNTAPNVDITNKTYAELEAMGFSKRNDVFNSESDQGISVDLGGEVGNTLLIGTYGIENGSDIDRFKIRNLTTQSVSVSSPVTLALFGLGLLGLARRRMK